MIKYISLFALLTCSVLLCSAQRVTPTSEEIKSLTPDWKGERFPDGRPKVPDDLLRRLKAVRLEEAWGILRNKGYHNQFEGDWTVLHTDSVMTGRALTAQYLPLRPDIDNLIKATGKAEGRIGA
ncbi:MAG TPA: RraA family protein, partial [Chitinophagaceae bacterium]|nr:RraA family protein [Chitinophagaceae bacterium]